MAKLDVKKLLNPPSPGDVNTLSFTRDSRGRLVTHLSDKQGLEVASTYETEEIRTLIDERVTESPILSGPASLNLNSTGSYRILNYDFTETYQLETINGGVVTRIDDVITYKAPATGREAGFIINTSSKIITLINPSEVLPPAITSPTMGDQEIFESTTVIATGFNTVGENDSHVASTWQISLTETFDTLYMFSNDNQVNLTSWPISSLPNDTTFYVRVKFKGSALGYGDWSPIVSFKTLGLLIAKPTVTNPVDESTDNGSTVNLTSSSFTVIAGSGTHASTDWQVASDNTFNTIVEESLNNTSGLTSFQVNDLDVSTTYYARVRFQSDNGTYSAWSNFITFGTKSTFETAPVKPSITYPVNAATDVGESVTASSSAFAVASGVDTQKYGTWELATDIGFNNVIKDSVDSSTDKTSWLITDLSVNTTYYLRVKHTGNVTGESLWSDTVSFTTLTTFVDKPDMPVITNPTNAEQNVTIFPSITTNAFGVASGTDTHIESSWELSTDQTFATVDVSSSNDSTNLVSWSPAGLALNTTYYVRVKHIGSASGESDWSGVVSFTTREFAINKPNITSPTESSTSNYESVTVTTSAFDSEYEEGHDSTEWELSFSNNFASPDVTTGDSSDLVSHVFSGLTEGEDVYVRVRYKDENGRMSDWSDVRHFETNAHFVNKPDITSPSNGAISIGPTPTITSSNFGSGSGNLTHVSSDWQISTINDFSVLVDESLADTTNKTSIVFSTTLDEDTTYYVRVRYNSADFTSEWSTGSIFTTNVSWVNKPTITSPVNGATNIGANVTITSSAYSTVVPALLHVSSDWQLATDSNFSTIVYQSMDDTSNLTSWTAGPLSENTTYYVRVRHSGSDE